MLVPQFDDLPLLQVVQPGAMPVHDHYNTGPIARNQDPHQDTNQHDSRLVGARFARIRHQFVERPGG